MLDPGWNTVAMLPRRKYRVREVEDGWEVLAFDQQTADMAAGGSATPAEAWHPFAPRDTVSGKCGALMDGGKLCGRGNGSFVHRRPPSAGRATHDHQQSLVVSGPPATPEMPQGAAPTPAVCCPGGVAPHEFGSDDWNDNPEACELCNHREDHPIHQRGAEPVALPHVDNGYGDCIGCGIDDETGNSRSSSADCHVQRATQGTAPTHEYVPDRLITGTELCGWRVSLDDEPCDKQREDPIHQRDEPQGTQSTEPPEIDLQKIPGDLHPVGCRCTFHAHRGCGLVHPHTATTKCPG